MKRITINSEDRNLNKSSIVVGYLEENKIEKIKFDIPEEYKDFSKKACFKAQDKTFVKIFDDVVGDTLTFTSDITKYSDLDMTIVFFKQDNEDEIIAKTSKLHIKIKDAIICDDDVQPDEPKVILLDQLIETVTNKINEVNNLNIKGERVEDGVNVIFTDKQGNESVQKVNDGESGKGIPQGGNKGQVLIKKSENDYDTEWGSAAGVSIASRENLGVIKVGENLNISEDGTLSAEKSTQSYTELTDKPKINNVELDGEKSLDDLGIQAKGNYALKNEIPTKTSELNNDSGFLTSIPNDYKTKEENDELYQAKGNYATKEELPTKTSQLENDSNFISEIPVASTSTLGGIKVGDNLEITADGILNALVGGSGAFPIIDATGETEINLDDYLDDGTWIIKGNNVKQIKGYGSTLVRNIDWAILEIRTHKWTSNSFVYQILQFPIMAYNNGGLEKHLNYGIRQIKPSIETTFKNYAIPISTTNYYDTIPENGYETVLSAMGSYNMYTALMSYLTNNINKKPHLSDLNTTDKTSLVNAINEINDKITSGTFATNLAEVQGYDSTKTQVLKNINGILTWVEE